MTWIASQLHVVHLLLRTLIICILQSIIICKKLLAQRARYRGCVDLIEIHSGAKLFDNITIISTNQPQPFLIKFFQQSLLQFTLFLFNYFFSKIAAH